MAALNKRWVGTTSTPTTITNWAPVSLRNAAYSWTVSGSGTAEYYLRTAANGDPGISDPGATAGAITGGDVNFTNGTMGSLTAGQFDYGDNDTLGYNTIYIRMSVAGDPDAQALDYIKLYQIPVATDHVRIPAGSGAMTGVDWTGIAIGDFIVEEGAAALGSSTVPLSIDPDRFEFSGLNASYIHSVGAIAHDVRNAGQGNNGTPGLFLTMTQGTVLSVYKGTVGVAALHGQTSTVTTARCNGGTLILGKNASVTTAYVSGGKLWQNCSTTTTNVYGDGTLQTEEAGTIGTLNADQQGKCILNSTGTITTANMQAGFQGVIDMLKSAEARTITTLNHKAGTIELDRGIVTVTTYAVSDSKPQRVQITNASGSTGSGFGGF